MTQFAKRRLGPALCLRGRRGCLKFLVDVRIVRLRSIFGVILM